MSDSLLHQHQIRMGAQHKMVSDLTQRLFTLTESRQTLQSQHNKLTQSLRLKQTEITDLKHQIATRDSLISQLESRIRDKEESYKQLYDNTYTLQPLSFKQQQFLIQSYDLHSQITDIKLQAEQQQSTVLEKQLGEKQKVIKRILKENSELRESILKITQEHYLKIIEMKKKGGERGEERKQREAGEGPNHWCYESASTDYLIQIKDAQLEEVEEKYQQELERNKVMVEREKALRAELADARREYYCTSIDLVYIENNRLVEENQALKSQLGEIDPARIQEFKGKLQSYLKKIDEIDSLENRIVELEELIVKKSSEIEEDYNSQETEHLRQKSTQLSSQLQQSFIILSRFNEAFQKINPYFDIYQYDLVNFAEISKEILTSDEVKECNNFALKLSKVEREERALNLRKSNFEKEVSNWSVGFQKKIKAFREEKEAFETQKEFILQKKSHDRIIKIGTDKINQLLEIINQLRGKEIFWQGEKKILCEKLEQAVEQHKKYEFMRENPLNSIQLPSIVIPNIQYIQPNKDLSQSLTGLQRESNRLNTQIGGLIQEQKVSLITIEESKKRIHSISEQLKVSNFKLNQLLKSQTFKNQRIHHLEQELRNKGSNERVEVDEPHQHQIIDHAFTLATNSDITTELVRQLSEVLNHNQAITGKLLEELEKVKGEYERLEEVNRESNVGAERMVSENGELKLKLTQAVIEVESAIARESEMQEEISLLRSEHERLERECLLKQQQTDLYKQTIASQLDQLNTNVRPVFDPSLQTPTTDSPLNQNSPSLISIIQTLKQLINQKNQDIIALQNEVSLSQRTKLTHTTQQPAEPQLQALLTKAIGVITRLKSK